MFEALKRNSFRGFSLNQIKLLSQQLLRSLAILQSECIIHCDLKPENILFTDPRNQKIKLIDFGSSCFSNQRVHSYLQSRFYRAPEIILGISYTTSIDI